MASFAALAAVAVMALWVGVRCTVDSTAFPPVCGDGVRDVGEICDGADLGAAECTKLGFDGGELLCGADCASFDTSACTKTAGCGNGVLDPSEACEGKDVGSATCETLGHDGGYLTCTGCAYDTLGCFTCGDGVAKGPESCDGADLKGFDCTTIEQGYIGGALACATDCSGWDTAGCTPPPNCGDGVISGIEECEPGDTAGLTCADGGYQGGVLTCTGGCVLDWGTCTGTPLNRDFNGDGYDDFIVGADIAVDSSGAATGAAYIYFGGSAPDSVADGFLYGEAFDDMFGVSAAAAGDVNGDGFGDIIVGAPGNDAAGDSSGRAYV